MMNKLRNHMKGIMLVIAIAFLASTFMMYEGRSSRRGPQRNADGTMSDYEVAEINGQHLMRSDLERRVRSILENLDSRSVASLDITEVYQSALNQYVFESQIANEVKSQGIKISDEETDRAMKTFADQNFPTREAFYQALQNSGISVESYKASLARELASEQVVRNSIGTVEVSEDQAVAMYDALSNLFFRQPSGYKIQIADFKNHADADRFRNVLLEGTDWGTVISEDRITTMGLAVIDATTVPVIAYDSLFEPEGRFAAMASLDIGEVSPVFAINTKTTSDDYAVAVKVERIEESITPYDNVSADIRNMIRQQEERARIIEFQNSLLNKAKIEIFDPSLFPAPEPETPAAEPEAAPTEAATSEAAPAELEASAPEVTPAELAAPAEPETSK